MFYRAVWVVGIAWRASISCHVGQGDLSLLAELFEGTCIAHDEASLGMGHGHRSQLTRHEPGACTRFRAQSDPAALEAVGGVVRERDRSFGRAEPRILQESDLHQDLETVADAEHQSTLRNEFLLRPVLPGWLQFDIHVAYSLLSARTFVKASPIDPIGGFDVSGQIFMGGLTMEVGFE